MPQYEIVDLFPIEKRRLHVIIVRVAKRKLAGRGLRHHCVNAESVVLRGFICNAFAQRRKRGADAEGWIKAEGQSTSERWPQIPTVRLHRSTEHLESATRKATPREKLRVKRLKI